jgi:hypothetical protein
VLQVEQGGWEDSVECVLLILLRPQTPSHASLLADTVASSSTTDSSPFSSLIGTLGLDDGVSGFLSGLVSGDSLGLGGLVRFVKRQFDGKTIGALTSAPFSTSI